jgi:H+/Cl- antiporter ClcA
LVQPPPPSRLARLTLLAAGVGAAAGAAAWALVHLIGLITNLALFHRRGWELPDLAEVERGPLVVLVAVAGAMGVALLARWAPIIKGHGLPEAMDAVLTKQSRVAPRTAVAKPLSAALAIGTGGPFGAEGPIIVTGGALGSLLGQALHVSATERKILLASGAAAGMAATFGSPLAAVVLAIELLLFEFSSRAFVPLVVATSVAAAVHAATFGSGPLFTVPEHDFAGLAQLPLYVPLGLFCGLLATVIAKGLFAVEALYRRLPVTDFWHPAIGAVAFASLGLLVPRALGVGYGVIDDALAGRLAVGTLAALAAGKLVIWWIALASGTSGGTLAPILLISACTGSLIGQGVDHLLPGADVSPGAFALAAMSATFGAATRAPFASIVFLFELTRDYDAMLPIMLATVLADLVARAYLPASLMTERLVHRGVLVPGSYHPDLLGTTPVRAVMSTGADALAMVDGASHTVTVGPGEPVAVAAELLVDEATDALPVLEHGQLVGVVTAADVLRVRARHLESEQPEPGWLARVRIGEG